MSSYMWSGERNAWKEFHGGEIQTCYSWFCTSDILMTIMFYKYISLDEVMHTKVAIYLYCKAGLLCPLHAVCHRYGTHRPDATSCGYCVCIWISLKNSRDTQIKLNFLFLLKNGECLHMRIQWLTLKSASHDNWCTVGGDGGCRVGEVWAGTTSPMPDRKGFKLQ